MIDTNVSAEPEQSVFLLKEKEILLYARTALLYCQSGSCLLLCAN